MSLIRNRVRAAALGACASLACIAGLANAAQFAINNTRVHLDASHPVETIVLTNQEPRDVSFEIQVKRWTQKPDGSWELAPTQDLVVHPLIVKLPDAGTARVRVGSLAPGVTDEHAYRIEIQELPDTSAAGSGQIRMLTHVSMPVFVQPANAKSNLTIGVDKIDTRDLSLVLRNAGTAYAAPMPGTLSVRDAKGNTLHETKLDTVYVLAGATAPMHVALPASACARAATIEFATKDAAKPFVALVSADARRCKP